MTFALSNPIAVISIYMTHKPVSFNPTFFLRNQSFSTLYLVLREKSIRVVHSKSRIFHKKARTLYWKIYFTSFVHYYFIGSCNQIWISLENITFKEDKKKRIEIAFDSRFGIFIGYVSGISKQTTKKNMFWLMLWLLNCRPTKLGGLLLTNNANTICLQYLIFVKMTFSSLHLNRPEAFKIPLSSQETESICLQRTVCWWHWLHFSFFHSLTLFAFHKKPISFSNTHNHILIPFYGCVHSQFGLFFYIVPCLYNQCKAFCVQFYGK